MSKFSTALTAAVALTVLSTASFAAPVLTLSYKIVSQRAVGSNTVLKTINNSTFTATAPGAFDYQIEVDGTFSGADPGNSFGSLAFDANSGNGTPIPSTGASITHPTTAAYAWKAANPTWVDDNGDPANGIFRITGDQGASTTDLIGVIAVTQNDATQDSSGVFGGDSMDPRLSMLTLGGQLPGGGANPQAGPLKLGTFIVTWDGASNQSLSFANVQSAELDTTTLAYGATITGGNLGVASFVASNTPEPASLGLLAIGGAALLTRRTKRDVSGISIK